MMRDAVIFDLDGTLCDVSSIVHFVEGDDKDFDAFHGAAMECPPNPAVVEGVRQARADGHAILIVTSRSAKWRDYAIKWLDRHDIGFDALYTRIEADFRADELVKAELLEAIIDDGFQPVRAWEDNDRIIDLWRSHGLEVTAVPG